MSSKKVLKWNNFRRTYLKGKQTHQGRYICEECGLHVKIIDLHHTIKRSVRPDLVFEPSNIEMLCRFCHVSKHQISEQELSTEEDDLQDIW